TLDTLHTAARHVRRYQDAAEQVDEALEADADGPDELSDRLGDIYDRTVEAMCDDLNTPAATAAALEGVKAIEQTDRLNGAAARSARDWLDRTNALLGIVESEHETAPVQTKDDSALPSDHLETSIDDLLEEREAARADGDYARADAIRDTLEALGIEVMDRPEGPEWRRKVEL
ncbi:MAG: DALR domain-containing protein, partial [Salinibacter sp.]